MTNKMFYVYNKNYGKPTVIHNCYVSAENEAKRLAKKTLQPFEVLRIVSTIKPKVNIEVEYYD